MMIHCAITKKRERKKVNLLYIHNIAVTILNCDGFIKMTVTLSNLKPEPQKPAHSKAKCVAHLFSIKKSIKKKLNACCRI